VPVTSRNSDDYDGEQRDPSSEPWHNRTPAVLGASVLGIVVVGILVLAVTYVSRQFSEPTQAPNYYVEPSFSATSAPTSTPTTTQTITSTSPPVTSDINPGAPTSTTDTSGSETSGTETSPPETTAGEDDEETRRPTTRRTPRTNITRTLYPRP
jgi:cytoskeletal protein RodZ